MLLIVVVTSYVTTFLHFFIYCLPHHLFYLDMCDVTTYVTPTVGSLMEVISHTSIICMILVYDTPHYNELNNITKPKILLM